jgi:hypothetical protein
MYLASLRILKPLAKYQRLLTILVLQGTLDL